MDLIGNNIANVNSMAYKASRATFQEMMTQSMRSATAPSATRGGTNPMQIGLGATVASIDTLFTQGFMENTGVTTDLAISGDGFFVMGSGENRSYTRAGNFTFDATGRLVSPRTGAPVQGMMADVNGNVPPVGVLQDIVIPSDLRTPAQATTEVSIVGNLNAAANIGDSRTIQITVYDSLGTEQVVSLEFTKTALNEWSWAATDPAGNPAGAGTAEFTASGQLNAFTGAIGYLPTTGAAPLAIDVDAFGNGQFDGLTQFSRSASVYGRSNDGYSYGMLDNVSFDPNGTIYGSFTNGAVQALGRIVMAQFTNPEGLARVGDGMYGVTSNSGQVRLEYAGESGNTQVMSGALEMSNVDLAKEFTDMVVTQRGFQSNARVISVSDEMLAEIANLKR
jgi:flagellar hook protein FlgE